MARHNYFSHLGRYAPIRAALERAATATRGRQTSLPAGDEAEDAMAGWLKSPTHCATLMNPAYTEMGAAFATDAASDMGVYWAQAFGRPR